MLRVVRWLKRGVYSCVVRAAVLCLLPASRADVIYQFDNTFSGTNPTGPAPWVTASLLDISPGTVELGVSNVNVTTSEKISELYLNINTNYNPGNLQFTFLGGSTGVTAPQPSLGTDNFKADGDGKYDILFQFSQPPTNSFGAGDYLIYKITGIPTLTSADFVYLSTPAGGHGPFFSAIHVQGIAATSVTDSGNYSGWVSPSQVTIVAAPEPAAGALLLLAAGLFGVVRRWPRK